MTLGSFHVRYSWPESEMRINEITKEGGKSMNRVHGFVLTNSTPASPAVCQGVGVSAQRDRNWSYSIRQSGSEWFSSGFT